ncbi:MAG: N-acetyl-gamma-glutamyl-phosphate reductase [Thermoplasmatales archaeon]|nr:N-acetyl-gamma-glutamyl-phosphate reductase [Thermoplasmatales archaeon]
MKRIGIIGGTGYTGSELARILCCHPGVEIVSMTSRQSAGERVGDVHSHLKGLIDISFTSEITGDPDLVFVATPHGVSMHEVPGFMASGVRCIDLSGDYRMHDAEKYEKWYGKKHVDPGNIPKSVYGLPELFRDKIRGAKLVANPGCYATAAILACAPLVSKGLVEKEVNIDAKSGTSGAGASPSPRLHHPNCGASVIPYGVGTHRHTPEIEEILHRYSGKSIELFFVPHLVPIVRGILVDCYMTLRKDMTQDEIANVYRKQYEGEHFVSYREHPSIAGVVASNFAQVGFTKFGGRVVSYGVIDNLVKGASGQAVQNMNIMFGFDEKEGIAAPGLGV